MKARLRVPCPEWGVSSHRAFHVAIWIGDVVRGRLSRVARAERRIPASWGQRRPGLPGIPAAAHREAGVRR